MPKVHGSPVGVPSCAYVGIDPGMQGGLVTLFPGKEPSLTYMPDSIMELWYWFDKLNDYPSVRCYIEKVGGYIEGRSPGPAMFNFGYGVGQLWACAMGTARNHPDMMVDHVLPKVWESYFNISSRKKEGKKYVETQGKFKKRLRDKAQALYPRLDVWKKTQGAQLAVCDALLIATYGKRINERK